MEEFYKNWLRLQRQKGSNIDEVKRNEPSTTEVSTEPTSEESATEPKVTKPSDIVYESQDLKLIVQKGFHKRQKIFRLDDHLYYIKIQSKNSSKAPLLLEILDFLNAGFVHILDEIKSHYKTGN